jgi:hypothetical protein
MFTTIKKFLKDLLTEKFGDAYCPVRCFAFFLSVPSIVIFITGYSTQLIHGHFDGQGFATAFATLCGGFMAFGVSVAIKGMQEIP